jgi:hypothetical protein
MSTLPPRLLELQEPTSTPRKRKREPPTRTLVIMTSDGRNWLLQHLDHQARYLASLTAYARQNPDDRAVLLRVRDEMFTLRETLDTLAVPHALVNNTEWKRVPAGPHREPWPGANDLPE